MRQQVARRRIVLIILLGSYCSGFLPGLGCR